MPFSLLWGSGLARTSLQLPTQGRGLALPNLQCYLAAQLPHIHAWFSLIYQTPLLQLKLNVHLQPSKLENLLIDRDRAKFILKILLPYTV